LISKIARSQLCIASTTIDTGPLGDQNTLTLIPCSTTKTNEQNRSASGLVADAKQAMLGKLRKDELI
jgi:hypothetical protein